VPTSECDLGFGTRRPTHLASTDFGARSEKEATVERLRTAVLLEDAGEAVLLLDGVHSKLAAVVRANALGVSDA